MAATYASLSWSVVAVRSAASTARGDIDPVFKILNHPESFSVVARLPGLRRKDVSIEIDRDVLHIRGERLKGWLKPQRIAVERSVRLPEGLSSEGATATLRDGVLTITLPKRPEARRRTIPIRVAGEAASASASPALTPASSLGARWREAWKRFQARWVGAARSQSPAH